jgi:hypothetical protein
MKLILENWNKFLSEDQLDEVASVENAVAGVRRDFNAAKNNNLWDKFIEKYKDDKTPYGPYGDLDSTAQEKYKNYIQGKLKLAQAAIEVKQAAEEANTSQEKQKVQQAAEKVEQAIEKDEAEVAAEPAGEEAESNIIDALLSNNIQGWEGLKKVVTIYNNFVEKLNSPDKKQKLDPSIKAMIKYYDSKGKATQQSGNSVLMGVSSFGTENLRNNVKKALNNVLGLEQDDTPWEQSSAEQPVSGEEIEIKPLLDRFFNFLTKTGVLRESIGSLIKALGAKDTKLVGSSLSKNFKREEIKTLVKYLEEKENVLSFVNQYFANDPEKEQILQRLDDKSEEPSDEGETKVEVGGEEYTYTDEDIQILKKAYEAFASDQSGLMKVKTLRAQEELWIGLRDALNNIGKFRAIAGQERSYTNENLFEQENSPQIKRLVVDLERLRKDFNDTDETLKTYIEKAGGKSTEGGGQYEAKAYMARFLAELKDVQNSIAKAAADTQSMLNIEVNEVISEQDEEEESREQKIQNVRNVYENIKDLLGGILPELDRNVAAEPEEVSIKIKESYEELQKIRKYFRNVGAFAKTSDMDVGELEKEYLFVKKSIMTSMSRVIDDLRRNRLTPDVAKPFLEKLAKVGSFINDKFGVGPDEGFNFKSIEVSADDTSKEEIEADTNAEGPSAVNDIADDFDPDQANADIKAAAGEENSPEKVQKDVKIFIQKSKKFLDKIVIPLSSALRKDNKDALKQIQTQLAQLQKQKLLEEQNPAENLSSLVNKVQAAKDLIIDTLLFSSVDELILIKDELQRALKIFVVIYNKLKTVYNQPIEKVIGELDKINQGIDQELKNLKTPIKKIYQINKDTISNNLPFKQEFITFVQGDFPEEADPKLTHARLQQIKNLGNFDTEGDEEINVSPASAPDATLQENLLTRLIKYELKRLKWQKNGM